MSGDTKRTVSTAPPPRREVEVNLDTEAATDERPETPPSRALDLGGFSDPGATDGPVGVAERSTDRQSTTTTPRKSTRRARKPAAAPGAGRLNRGEEQDHSADPELPRRFSTKLDHNNRGVPTLTLY